jgi:hypothetical protein
MIKDYFNNYIYDDFANAYDLFDFHKNGKLYGLAFNESLYIPDIEKLKNYENFKNIKQPIQSLIKLQSTIGIESKNGRILNTNFFNINRFKVTSAFENPIEKYKLYCFFILSNNVKELQETYYNFNDFFEYFTGLANNNFLVFSDFICSSYITIRSSGLCFNIFKEENREKFMKDSAFGVYNNICKKHNFNIDKYNPGLIVYRINEAFYESNKDIYIDVYNNDLIITKQAIYDAYMLYHKTFVKEKELINVDDTLDENKFLHFYLKNKLVKNNLILSKKEYKRFFMFFIKNNEKNSLKSSLIKIKNAKIKNHNLFEDW